jgi:CDP-paratose 2-epimerase
MGKVIVTGACGFIGTCFSQRLIAEGHEVHGIDNLSRRGSEINAEELIGPRFTLHRVDLSDRARTFELFTEIGPVDAVYHLAAQVAVTKSYVDRERDFLDNAQASFNVIESVKRHTPEAYCLFASTNKVYGHLEVAEPVGLDYPLAPYTPYGVSKAAGEMYFSEYGRPELGLTTCALRQSCIYGHHQFGVEDQGWVAWFAIANILERPITIYGDGEQVRDLLFVDDLVNLYLECWERRLSGVYPVGGGPENAVNLKDGLRAIEEVTGKKFAETHFSETRPGDQPYFVADLSWAGPIGLSWRPKVGVGEGIRSMVDWITANDGKIGDVLG